MPAADRPIRGLVGTARAVVVEAREREVPFMAAAIAYYTLVSLVPLLVLALLIAVAVGGDPLRAEIEVYVRERLPAAGGLVGSALEDRTGRGGLGVVSLLVTIWGSLRVFRGLDVAFSRIYGSGDVGLVDQVRDALIALAALGAGLLGVVALTAAIAVADSPIVDLLGPLVSLAALSVAFLPFYYVFPDVGVSVREVLPGTVLAAVGFTLLGSAFGAYAALAAGVAGALGAVLLLVTYFYFAGTLLLAGAVLNAVLAGRLANRQLQQAATPDG